MQIAFDQLEDRLQDYLLLFIIMQVIQVQQDVVRVRMMEMCCRLPCLRHTPIKELHRISKYMKETTFRPGAETVPDACMAACRQRT